MSRTRVVLFGLLVLLLAGLVLPLVLRSRVTSDRISCENHFRYLGLLGVRHASVPGKGLPSDPRDELPPGTFQNSVLPTDERMSWFVYTLNVLNDGPPNPEPRSKHRRPTGLAELLKTFDPDGPWGSAANKPLANYRLAAAICPAQVREYPAGAPVPTNYLAVGGLELDTPAKALDEAGPRAGAYRYDGPTPFAAFKDGLRQTAQMIETNTDLGPWLQGGPSTLRGLDPAATPYVGAGRQFGGCHPGGVFVSLADGSVQFVKDTVHPAVFRSLMTLAGGPADADFDTP